MIKSNIWYNVIFFAISMIQEICVAGYKFLRNTNHLSFFIHTTTPPMVHFKYFRFLFNFQIGRHENFNSIWMKLWNFFLVIVWNYHNKVNKAGSFPRTACWHLGDVKYLMLISFQFKGPKCYLCKQYGDFIQKWISLQKPK